MNLKNIEKGLPGFAFAYIFFLRVKSVFKKKIKQVLIVFRDKEIQSCAHDVALWLKKKGILTRSFSQSSIQKKTLTYYADFIVVLGGDGTYLSAVRFIQGKKIPILGINMGSLGFLTVHFKKKLYECLDKTCKGLMKIDERSLLEVYVNKKGKVNNKGLALNDIVIERGGISQLIDIAVYLKDKPVYSLKADGLIISSATGSTAYNLSAGGPILYPQVNAFVVTPICPHSLTHRPVLFPDDRILKFQVRNISKKLAILTVDGRTHCRLSHLSFVVVKKSNQIHLALRDSEHSNFIFLKDKLKFFERPV